MHRDLGATVLRRFQDHLGVADEIRPEWDLRDDLGIDSVVLVVIMLDVADELELDLASTQVTLFGIYTVKDVIGLIQAVYDEQY